MTLTHRTLRREKPQPVHDTHVGVHINPLQTLNTFPGPSQAPPCSKTIQTHRIRVVDLPTLPASCQSFPLNTTVRSFASISFALPTSLSPDTDSFSFPSDNVLVSSLHHRRYPNYRYGFVPVLTGIAFVEANSRPSPCHSILLLPESKKPPTFLASDKHSLFLSAIVLASLHPAAAILASVRFLRRPFQLPHSVPDVPDVPDVPAPSCPYSCAFYAYPYR